MNLYCEMLERTYMSAQVINSIITGELPNQMFSPDGLQILKNMVSVKPLLHQVLFWMFYMIQGKIPLTPKEAVFMQMCNSIRISPCLVQIQTGIPLCLT